MITETWTAIEKDDSTVTFQIEGETGNKRIEIKYINELPLMFWQGGCPSHMGVTVQILKIPWSFKIVNGYIYM